MSEKLIGLEDLPDKMRVGLEDEFRKRLFELAIKKVKKVVTLAKELECHTDTVLNLRKGRFFLKTIHLKRLSHISFVSLEDIEKHVTELKSRNKKDRIKIKLPISSSPELASLIGHCIGDGNLSERQFSFFNRKRELVDEVIENAQKAFSTNIRPVEFEKDGGWEIEFPTCIARLVALAGGPSGEKVFLSFDVPEWIKNGENRIKTTFIRALFDDEGSVISKFNKSSKGTSRTIRLGMAKNEKFLTDHLKFLESVRTILMNLGIESLKIHKSARTRNGILIEFSVSRFENLNKFLEIISFTSEEKRQKLINCLESFKNFENKLIESRLKDSSVLKV